MSGYWLRVDGLLQGTLSGAPTYIAWMASGHEPKWLAGRCKKLGDGWLLSENGQPDVDVWILARVENDLLEGRLS